MTSVQAAPPSGDRVGTREIGSQRAEHLLAARLGRVVRGLAQVLVGQRQLGDGPPRLGVLHEERPRGVGQVVLFAELPQPHRDLDKPVARQVGIDVVLDLIAQVPGHQAHHRPGVDVRAAQDLP